MKAALGLQLATALEAAYGHRCLAWGGDADSKALPGLTIRSATSVRDGGEGGVDVLMEGFAFRIFLHSGREDATAVIAAAALAASAEEPSAAATSAAVAASAVAVATGEANPTAISWHHGLVCGVAALTPAFAPACRLAQRWVASQMLSNHISPEVVELMVASVFAHPAAALPAPGSRMTGFLRFLHLLAQHPWATAPLVVDPLGQLSETARRGITQRFEARVAAAAAPAGPKMPALFVVTSRDTESAQWWVWFKSKRDLGRMEYCCVVA